MDKKLHHRLKQYRLKCGYSVSLFAQKIGVSTSTYREWEYGRAIRGEPYLKMAEVLGVSVSQLLSGKKSTDFIYLEKINLIESILAELKKELISFR